jgi:hypothetical protein
MSIVFPAFCMASGLGGAGLIKEIDTDGLNDPTVGIGEVEEAEESRAAIELILRGRRLPRLPWLPTGHLLAADHAGYSARVVSAWVSTILTNTAL